MILTNYAQKSPWTLCYMLGPGLGPNFSFIRVICKVKEMKPWAHGPNLDFMRINTKSSIVFLMLKLSYTKNGVTLLTIWFVACPARLGGPN